MDYPTIIKNIPEEYTQYFIQYINKNKHTYNIFGYEDDDVFLQLYGLTEKSKIWGRKQVYTNEITKDNDEEFGNYITKILDSFKIDYNRVQVYIKTCYLPVPIHVDAEVYGKKNKHIEGLQVDLREDILNEGCSMIIPLTFNKNINTIIFKNIAEDNECLRDFIQTITNYPTYEHNLDYEEYMPNIWNKGTPDIKILDYLEVDKIVVWEENVAFAFNRRRVHTSNNFKRYNIKSKDFILVHCD